MNVGRRRLKRHTEKRPFTVMKCEQRRGDVSPTSDARDHRADASATLSGLHAARCGYDAG